jgi:hypothetical protein
MILNKKGGFQLEDTVKEGVKRSQADKNMKDKKARGGRHFWIRFSLKALTRTSTWSTLPKIMRMLPGRNVPSFFRVGNVSGTTNLSYRIWAARRQTPEEIAHKMMRMEERGSKTQLTLSKRVESLTRNQPGKGRMRRGGYADAMRGECGKAAEETDVPRNSKMLKNMLAAVKDGPTTACLRCSREKTRGRCLRWAEDGGSAAEQVWRVRYMV